MFKSLSYDLSEVIKLFKRRSLFDLRGLSSRLIREAAIETNYAKAELGVIAYSLHKIESKAHFVYNPKWTNIKNSIINNLESAKFAAQNHNDKQVISKLKKVIFQIINIDAKIGNYIQNIYDKSKVKQASLAYSFGLSVAQAAALTGADKKDLQSYIGFTKMSDEEKEIKNLSTRVLALKKILMG
jgi:aromatic ring-opening dioxygenase LigB subunit